jgi:hypothetical protein
MRHLFQHQVLGSKARQRGVRTFHKVNLTPDSAVAPPG